MNFKEFITRLYVLDVEGKLKEDTKIMFFADYGDCGYNEVKEIEIDENGNIVVSGH